MFFASFLVGCTGGDSGGMAVHPDGGAEAALEWMRPDEWGPHGVGVKTLSWTDHRGKALVADVWYPAWTEPDAPRAAYEPTTLTMSAVRDAPIDRRGGPLSVIAFSHGFAGIRFQSAFLMEHLASHGWVIISPDHPGNTFLDINPDATGQVVLERPGDIRSAVDHLLGWADAQEDGWGGAIDGSRYAMVGHSFGALTAMMVGGGAVDLTRVAEMCDAGEVGGVACAYIRDVDPTGIVGTAEADPRAEVMVPMSPGVWYGFGPRGEGLGTTVPSLTMGGRADSVLGYDAEIRPTWEALGLPRTLASFDDAGHLVFSDICLISEFLSPECGDEEGWVDLGAAQATIKTLVTAWLDVHFRAEPRAGAWLSEAGLDEPHFLTLETVGR
ncbi:MAG: hypothetical protein VX000_17640 [Myxococcota bacterium]|nr:hypothetical protein [Myxococcota bacterium]